MVVLVLAGVPKRDLAEQALLQRYRVGTGIALHYY